MNKHDIPLKTRIFLKRQEIDNRLKNIKKCATQKKVKSSNGETQKSERMQLIRNRLRLRKFCEGDEHLFRYIEKPDLDYSQIDFRYPARPVSVCTSCNDIQIPPVNKCVKCMSTEIYKTEMAIPRQKGVTRIKKCDCCGYTERAGYQTKTKYIMPEVRKQ